MDEGDATQRKNIHAIRTCERGKKEKEKVRENGEERRVSVTSTIGEQCVHRSSKACSFAMLCRKIQPGISPTDDKLYGTLTISFKEIVNCRSSGAYSQVSLSIQPSDQHFLGSSSC
jgi:hypothetical protein